MPSLVVKDERPVLIDHSLTLILDSDTVNLRYDLKDGTYDILIFNDHSGPLELSEIGSISNAAVKINHLQLESSSLKQDSHIDVCQGSSLDVNMTCLGCSRKEILFDLFNRERDTIVRISNNIVCLEDSDFTLDCIGTINKGARHAQCHQKTHCLTMGDPRKARVLPVLNIDENDVEASHSLAAGTIDEEVLFYMNSRGLNKKDALNLILRSYLMPADDYYDSFEEGMAIRDRAIGKVDAICSM